MGPDPVDPGELELGARSPLVNGSGEPTPRERRRRLLAQRSELGPDPSEVTRPTFDRSESRLNKIVTGTGALTALAGGLFGSEIVAEAGAGLAEGGARNLARQRENFRRRRRAFREQLRSAREFERDVALATNEARVRGAEAAIERKAQREAEERAQRREKELMKLRDRLDRKLSAPAKRRLQKEFELLDAEIAAERALRTERLQQAQASEALAERRRRNGRGDSADVQLPDSLDATERKIDEMVGRAQRLHDEGASNSTLRDVQDEIVRLKEHRDSLRQRGAPRDTTEADTAGAAGPARRDSTAAPADTTERRIPEGASGGIGGGGAGTPAHGRSELRSVPGGTGGSLGSRTMDSLVEDALTLAWERGPEEVERRLSVLVENGRLSEQRAKAVLERMRQERRRMTESATGRSRPAAPLDDVAAADSLDRETAQSVADQLVREMGRDTALAQVERALVEGRLSPQQVDAIVDAIEPK